MCQPHMFTWLSLTVTLAETDFFFYSFMIFMLMYTLKFRIYTPDICLFALDFQGRLTWKGKTSHPFTSTLWIVATIFCLYFFSLITLIIVLNKYFLLQENWNCAVRQPNPPALCAFVGPCEVGGECRKGWEMRGTSAVHLWTGQFFCCTTVVLIRDA